MRPTQFLPLFFTSMLVPLLVHAQSPAPLGTVVDQFLPVPVGLPDVLCSDTEFLRRVSLDLVGFPPTASETRVYLTDPSPNKRERLVDQLLLSPRFAFHFATTLDTWLMERRPNGLIPQDEWYAWLLKSIREGKPWNVLAREVLLADGSDPASRPAARFYLDRGSEPNPIARDIGRVFFGRDLQCAQCHDHPIVEDFRQADYHGLLAFSAPGYAVNVKDGDKQITVYGEKTGADLSFESVFEKGIPHRTAPRVPGGPLLEEPAFYPGEEYATAPADGVKAVPKFSRRKMLAEQATNGTNRAFNENLANRLWAHMFGRGLVHPLDMHHPHNPPLQPSLMKHLGEYLAASNFNVKQFVRELALTRAYQRPYDAPVELPGAASQAANPAQTLQAQRETASSAAAAATQTYQKLKDDFAEAEKALVPVATELDVAMQACAEAKKNLDAAATLVGALQQQMTAKQAIATSLQSAVAATQTVAQQLAGDAELVAAAQKFAERSQHVASEIAAIQKTIDEKTAALASVTTAHDAARGNVDNIRAKLQPLREVLKHKDAELLATREQMQSLVTDLSAVESQLATVQHLAGLTPLEQRIETARQQTSAAEAAKRAAIEQFTAYAAVVGERELALKASTEVLAAATAALEVQQSRQLKHTALLNDLTKAIESTNAARQQLPDDTVLAEVAASLDQRLKSQQTESLELKAKQEAAAAVMLAAQTAQDESQQQYSTAALERQRLEQQVAATGNTFAAARSEMANLEGEYAASKHSVVERLAQNFVLATLKPLTPEQLCWSVFQITGVTSRHRAIEAAKLEASAPVTEAQRQDEQFLVARATEIEHNTYHVLKGNVATFVQYYAAGPGQPQSDFFATADQALFAANGDQITSWIAPAAGNVTELVIQQADPKLAADELYLTLLTRFPTEAESTAVVERLASRKTDKAAAAQELVWGILNSAEFRFNH